MHNHLRRAAAAAFAASALALVAACGDGAADDKATSRDETPAASVSASPTPSEPPAEPLSTREAEKALLADGDLPQGWKLDPEVIIDATGGAPEDVLAKPADATCLPLVDLFNTGRIAAGHKANAQAVFFKDDSIFGHDVSSYAADKAQSVMTALAKAVTDCGTFDSEYGGGKAKVTTKPLKVTEVGDETLGFSVQVAFGDEVVDVEYAVVRDGANITSVQHNWVNDHDAAAFTKGLAKAAANLSAAAQD